MNRHTLKLISLSALRHYVFLFECVFMCGRELISELPLLKKLKKPSDVLDHFAGVFACECLRTASLPKLKCLID